MYPFPRGSVGFKTPPKRKSVPPLSAVLESDWSGVDDWSAGVVEKETFSPRLVDAISRRIVEEVESRTVPTIQTGWFCFLDFVYSLLVRLLCMLWLLSCGIVAGLVIRMFCCLGFTELSERVEDQLGSKRKTKKYSKQNLLNKKMLDLDPLYRDFVSGPKCGKATYFHCNVCHRDVSMTSRGSGEFSRQFESNRHWQKDVTYRVHMGLPVYNKLMEKMDLSAQQVADFKSRPFVDLSEGYAFPEDLLPKHSRVESRVPFMALVSCLCDLLRLVGDFALLRRLWNHFCSSLGEREPEYQLGWSRSETVVSIFFLSISP